jgi:predicted  nucleic acid-binding Zn-ribbon protein
MTHQKSTKALEHNITKKLEFTENLKKNFENLQNQFTKQAKENTHLKNQVKEAKRVLTQIQVTAEEKFKETLKKNYMDWKNQEKARILKIKQSVDKEVEDRLNLEKEVIF